jgi:hypothetical protein
LRRRIEEWTVSLSYDRSGSQARLAIIYVCSRVWDRRQHG